MAPGHLRDQHGAGVRAGPVQSTLDDARTLPEFVDGKLLEVLASEDRWQEYVTIDVGPSEGLNLRERSDKAGRKDDYDRYDP